MREERLRTTARGFALAGVYDEPAPREPVRFAHALRAAAEPLRPLLGDAALADLRALAWRRYVMLSLGRAEGLCPDAFGDCEGPLAPGPREYRADMAPAVAALTFGAAARLGDEGATLIPAEDAARGDGLVFAVGTLSGALVAIFESDRADDGVRDLAASTTSVYAQRGFVRRMRDRLGDDVGLHDAMRDELAFARDAVLCMARRFPVRETESTFRNALLSAALWNVLLASRDRG